MYKSFLNTYSEIHKDENTCLPLCLLGTVPLFTLLTTSLLLSPSLPLTSTLPSQHLSRHRPSSELCVQWCLPIDHRMAG